MGMNTIENASGTGRRPAQKTVKPVNFYFEAPEAQQVSLVGDFNDWDEAAHPMKRQPDGSWFVQASLAHGHHHYQFRVDGEARLDPKANGVARNARNERVSLLAVS
jgi:1,4-alpha-glucan branching enzyme